MPSTCEILGIDVTAQQQGAIVNATVVSPVTNAGNITACGTSSLQYINYNIDGTSYSVSSLVPGENMNALYIDSISVQTVDISSYHTNGGTNATAISFQFKNNSGTGGAVAYLVTPQFGYATTLLPPFAVTITNNALATGEFYEGNFTGQFKDQSGATHTITCSFRVRRV